MLGTRVWLLAFDDTADDVARFGSSFSVFFFFFLHTCVFASPSCQATASVWPVQPAAFAVCHSDCISMMD